MDLEKLNKYMTFLDDNDKQLIDKRVAEKGIEGYLNQQLIYLDCSRIINGMRMMQTIGYPYQREISSYYYVLAHYFGGDDEESDKMYNYWQDKLLERHQANLEYEKSNPPTWYGGKKAKDEWLKANKAKKLPRRKKAVEQTIPGMGKELSNKEKLKRLNSLFSGITFKIKPTKHDEL